MTIKGGKRPGAGRKKGVPNKITAAMREKALGSGTSPLEVLLGIMRKAEPKQRPKESVLVFVSRWKYWADQRLDAAKAAAPYIHPRLQSVEYQDNSDPKDYRVEVEFV